METPGEYRTGLQKNKVLGIGLATLDISMIYDEHPKIDTKSRAVDSYSGGGGNCANTLVGLSRLGIMCKMFGVVGTDDIGQIIIDGLNEEGIKTEEMNAVRHGEKSPISTVVVSKNQGTRTVYNAPSYDYMQSVGFLPSLQGVALIYYDGRLHHAARKIFEMARSEYPDVKIGIEAERKGLQVEELFKYADIVFTSREFHHEVFHSDNYQDNLDLIRMAGPEIVTVTLGEGGAIGMFNDEICKAQAIKTTMLDTTGAGDAFNAGFLFGYLKNLPPEKMLELAVYVASRKCQRFGSRQGLPALEDVIKTGILN